MNLNLNVMSQHIYFKLILENSRKDRKAWKIIFIRGRTPHSKLIFCASTITKKTTTKLVLVVIAVEHSSFHKHKLMIFFKSHN